VPPPITHAEVLVVHEGTVLARWPLATPGQPGLAVVEALAQWQLAARRAGCSLRLSGSSRQLRQLLELVGFERLVPDLDPGDGLVGQVVGEPELGEQAGVEEAVVPDDPVA
jgi:hypothetical protein